MHDITVLIIEEIKGVLFALFDSFNLIWLTYYTLWSLPIVSDS